MIAASNRRVRAAGAGAVISLSRRRPSGVHSKTHERMTAGANPIARMITTTRIAASDKPKTGNSVSTTWISSQAAATYAIATRWTLRRLISPQMVMTPFYRAGNVRARKAGIPAPLRGPIRLERNIEINSKTIPRFLRRIAGFQQVNGIDEKQSGENVHRRRK